MKAIQILVIDLKSQYTQVIGRSLRELGFRAAILAPKKAGKWLLKNNPKAIILSGGSNSVYDERAITPPEVIFEKKVPILGICYGMQWLAQWFGGEIHAALKDKEYGKAGIVIDNDIDPIFRGLIGNKTVWASHGDSVSKLPDGFKRIASSQTNSGIAAISNSEQKIWGLQFHPEVTHTEDGKKMLGNFLRICNVSLDWVPGDVIGDVQRGIKKAIGGKKAIIGFSGGVDSSTLTAIIQSELGKNLLVVCINTGGLRKNEINEVRANAKEVGVSLTVVNAARRFQKALRGVTDAEKKRDVFKKLYVVILEEIAKKFGAEFVIQGSLATDFIESQAAGEAELIKSHHNIGNKWKLTEIHPFRDIFKYEVRALARKLNLPEAISERQPFPGPGLFIRIVGIPVTIPKLSILRWADDKVRTILKNQGIYRDQSQVVVGLWGIKTVGIKGDKRSYAYPIVVRSVKTRDFMTVDGVDFPTDIKKEIEKAVTVHPQINRVVWDTTDKPPATTEFE